MKRYFIHNGMEQEGPFTADELKAKNILATTPIWFNGIDEWTLAGNVEELKKFVKLYPPAYETSVDGSASTFEESQGNEPKVKSKLLLFVMSCIAAFLIFLCFSFGYKLFSNEAGTNTSFIQIHHTPEELENLMPTHFLKVAGNYNRNFWGNKFVLKGKIENTATSTSYKDVLLKISYYATGDSLVGTRDYTIYEVFPAQADKEFKVKVDTYKNADNIKLELIDAQVHK